MILKQGTEDIEIPILGAQDLIAMSVIRLQKEVEDTLKGHPLPPTESGSGGHE